MQPTTKSTNKVRSPNYPAINLAEAIDRLRAIYEKQRRYPATREILAKLMGYGSVNGASSTVLSALSKFGLLEGYGDTLRVSELGQDLVLHRKGDAEYTAALQTAAFMPAFFQEMQAQYPDGLPHDHSVRAALIKRGFTPKASDAAIRAYRDTMDHVAAEIGDALANVAEDSSMNVVVESQPGAASPVYVSPVQRSDQPQRVIQIPLSVTDWATLQASFPLTEGAWNQMIAVLTVMKPALVAPTGAESAEMVVPAQSQLAGAELHQSLALPDDTDDGPDDG